MTTRRPFDRHLSEWLAETAEHRVPDHLEEVLAVTRHVRQRPWWSSLERWLPMQATARLVPAFPRLNQALIVVAIALALVAAALLAGVGRPRLPAPFGPALNGSLLSTDPGDIFVSGSNGAGRRPLLNDGATDLSPRFMRNGTRFLFWRNVGYDASLPMIANADGSGVAPLLDSPLVNPLGFDWSPTDDRLAVVHVNGDFRVLSLIDVSRHSLADVALPDGTIPDFDVQWRPTDGRELVFTEDLDNGGTGGALDAVRADGSGFRSILPAPARDAYRGLALSPDGRTAAVSFLDGNPGQLDRHAHIHFVDLDTGIEHRVVFDSPTADETDFTYSPDGQTGLVIATVGGRSQVLLVRVDGATAARPVGPVFADTDHATLLFSPDGRTVVIHVDTTRPVFVDVATGATRVADVAFGKVWSWQRLGP